MINLVIEITATVIDGIFLGWFVSRFLNVKISTKWYSTIWLVLLVIYQIIVDEVLEAFDMIGLIGAVVIAICFSLSLETKQYIWSIFSALLYLIVIMMSSNIAYPMFSLFVQDIDVAVYSEDSYFRVLYLLACKLIQFALYRLLLLLFHKEKTLDFKNGVLSFLFTFMSAFALGILTRFATSTDTIHFDLYVLIISVILVFINIILYVMIYQLQCLMKSKYDLLLLQDRLEFEKNRIEEVSTVWNNIRQVKHDLQNHFSVIGAHLAQGNFSLCQDYISKLNNTIETMGNLIQSGNTVIDYLINSKLTNLDNVEILVSGYVGNYNDIDDVDLACILGNILDNAIEAQSEILSDKRIELLFISNKTGRTIICKNTVKGSVLDNNSKLKSTKRNPEIHGIGHHIVVSTVNKYNGFVEYFEHDNMFGVQIFIPS